MGMDVQQCILADSVDFPESEHDKNTEKKENMQWRDGFFRVKS